ncbi:hypothetical protein BESB_073810 [Besnoitia besnoiti]|uniref:Uncharacterized protein n=1 Tax=Besnoitia besnoiti TaxID=94643 RepID=A0A2A9M8I2_BESBE|nr:uncharacterized protein BESB_073810 [Besnoitia besnoiti]PFH34229.1 hypothetical protein BESB_073810 [Besnoitia besnoiti]
MLTLVSRPAAGRTTLPAAPEAPQSAGAYPLVGVDDGALSQNASSCVPASLAHVVEASCEAVAAGNKLSLAAKSQTPRAEAPPTESQKEGPATRAEAAAQPQLPPWDASDGDAPAGSEHQEENDMSRQLGVVGDGARGTETPEPAAHVSSDERDVEKASSLARFAGNSFVAIKAHLLASLKRLNASYTRLHTFTDASTAAADGPSSAPLASDASSSPSSDRLQQKDRQGESSGSGDDEGSSREQRGRVEVRAAALDLLLGVSSVLQAVNVLHVSQQMLNKRAEEGAPERLLEDAEELRAHLRRDAGLKREAEALSKLLRETPRLEGVASLQGILSQMRREGILDIDAAISAAISDKSRVVARTGDVFAELLTSDSIKEKTGGKVEAQAEATGEAGGQSQADGAGGAEATESDEASSPAGRGIAELLFSWWCPGDAPPQDQEARPRREAVGGNAERSKSTTEAPRQRAVGVKQGENCGVAPLLSFASLTTCASGPVEWTSSAREGRELSELERATASESDVEENVGGGRPIMGMGVPQAEKEKLLCFLRQNLGARPRENRAEALPREAAGSTRRGEDVESESATDVRVSEENEELDATEKAPKSAADVEETGSPQGREDEQDEEAQEDENSVDAGSPDAGGPELKSRALLSGQSSSSATASTSVNGAAGATAAKDAEDAEVARYYADLQELHRHQCAQLLRLREAEKRRQQLEQEHAEWLKEQREELQELSQQLQRPPLPTGSRLRGGSMLSSRSSNGVYRFGSAPVTQKEPSSILVPVSVLGGISKSSYATSRTHTRDGKGDRVVASGRNESAFSSCRPASETAVVPQPSCRVLFARQLEGNSASAGDGAESRTLPTWQTSLLRPHTYAWGAGRAVPRAVMNPRELMMRAAAKLQSLSKTQEETAETKAPVPSPEPNAADCARIETAAEEAGSLRVSKKSRNDVPGDRGSVARRPVATEAQGRPRTRPSMQRTQDEPLGAHEVVHQGRDGETKKVTTALTTRGESQSKPSREAAAPTDACLYQELVRSASEVATRRPVSVSFVDSRSPKGSQVSPSLRRVARTRSQSTEGGFHAKALRSVASASTTALGELESPDRQPSDPATRRLRVGTLMSRLDPLRYAGSVRRPPAPRTVASLGSRSTGTARSASRGAAAKAVQPVAERGRAEIPTAAPANMSDTLSFSRAGSPKSSRVSTQLEVEQRAALVLQRAPSAGPKVDTEQGGITAALKRRPFPQVRREKPRDGLYSLNASDGERGKPMAPTRIRGQVASSSVVAQAEVTRRESSAALSAEGSRSGEVQWQKSLRGPSQRAPTGATVEGRIHRDEESVGHAWLQKSGSHFKKPAVVGVRHARTMPANCTLEARAVGGDRTSPVGAEAARSERMPLVFYILIVGNSSGMAGAL